RCAAGQHHRSVIDIRVDKVGNVEAVRELRLASRKLPLALRRGLRNAATPVADGIKAEAAWSSRIPAAGKIRTSVRNVVVSVNANAAPEAGPINNKDREGRFRHPVYADPGQTRQEWTWVSQEANPFFLRGVKRGAAEADRRLDQVFTEWERSAGFR